MKMLIMFFNSTKTCSCGGKYGSRSNNIYEMKCHEAAIENDKEVIVIQKLLILSTTMG